MVTGSPKKGRDACLTAYRKLTGIDKQNTGEQVNFTIYKIINPFELAQKGILLEAINLFSLNNFLKSSLFTLK